MYSYHTIVCAIIYMYVCNNILFSILHVISNRAWCVSQMSLAWRKRIAAKANASVIFPTSTVAHVIRSDSNDKGNLLRTEGKQ